MKKINLSKVISISSLALALIIAGCAKDEPAQTEAAPVTTTSTQTTQDVESVQKVEDNSHTIKGPIFGTTYSIIFYANEVANVDDDEVKQGVENVLNDIDHQMSTFKKDSILSQFNQFDQVNTKFEVTKDIYTLVEIADKIYQETDYKYDITILPLVNIWGFGPQKITALPTDSEIAEVKKSIGFDKIKYYQEDGKYYLEKSVASLSIDLSSIAKGYAVDKVTDYLATIGAKNALVEIGGEIKVLGKSQKAGRTGWNIAIESPVINNVDHKVIYDDLSLVDNSIATSGNYRNFSYDQNGKRISHTIDPITGHPIDHLLASVSVINPSNAVADAYATALNVVGPEKALEIAEKENLAVFLIVHNGKTFEEKASSAFLKLTQK